jgi:hypothetical protein
MTSPLSVRAVFSFFRAGITVEYSLTVGGVFTLRVSAMAREAAKPGLVLLLEGVQLSAGATAAQRTTLPGETRPLSPVTGLSRIGVGSGAGYYADAATGDLFVRLHQPQAGVNLEITGLTVV